MPKKKKSNYKGKPNKKKVVNQKQGGNQQRWVILGSTVAVLIIIFAIVAIVVQNNNKSAENDKLTLNDNPSGQASITKLDYSGQPSMGKEDAPIKIAEFGDYQCPVCQQFTLKIFPELKKDFIDTGKVQFYFMNYTIIGPGSVLAADAAESIYKNYPDKFWDFHELLYKNQGEENKWVTNEILTKVAKKAVPDLDEQKLAWDMDQVTYKDEVTADKNMGTALGVTGTPTLFINGEEVSTEETFDYSKLKKLIEKTLNKGE